MIDQAERKLKRVKINLMRDDRFAYWRGIMMVGKTELVENFPTAYTDGYNEGYGRAFVESQNDKQVAFGVLHENLHKIGRDLTVWRKLFEEDKQLANMACDYRNNLLLVEMDPLELTIQMPTNPDGSRMGLLDMRFKGMDVPTIFRILKQEKESGTGAFGPGGDANQPGNGLDEHDWQAGEQVGAEAQDARDKEIDQALRQGEMEHKKVNGNKAGDMERHLSDLLKPKINWKEALADFVRSACNGKDQSTWRRPNRRYLGVDIIMPSTISEKAETFVIGVDASGSTYVGNTLTQFLSEVKSICDDVMPETVELLYWDSHVAGRETYRGNEVSNLVNSTKPRGGGGTQPECVPIYLEAERIAPQCIIMLTDGEFYGDAWHEWQRTNAPVLWCVVGNKNFVPKHGQSVYVE